jgi:hypothetical protein
MKGKQQNRWLLSVLIIVVVLAVSIVIITINCIPSESIVMKAVSDDSGGAIAVWYQNGSIHLQRIDAEGALLWPEDLTLKNAGINNPYHFRLVKDGRGGAIITWGDMPQLSNDPEDPAYFDPVPVFAQRISSNGEFLWDQGVPAGVAIHYGHSLQLPVMIPDGTGGAYILWNDYQPVYRALHDDYIRLQRLSPEGKPVWEEPGKLLFASPPYHTTTPEEKTQGERAIVNRSEPIWTDFDMVSDGDGGAIVVWKEENQDSSADVRAQRYNAEGQSLWEKDGILIHNGWNVRYQLLSDDNGGVCIAVQTYNKYSSLSSCFIQKITAEGQLQWPDDRIVQPYDGIEIMLQGSDTIVLCKKNVGEMKIIYGMPVWSVDLYAQRINADGTIIWQRSPLYTFERGANFTNLVKCCDADMALIAWNPEYREQWEGKIFIQKINTGEGKPMWGKQGIQVFGEELRYQQYPVVLSDESAGAIILAIAGKNPIRGDSVYAQHLDADGSALWGAGIKVSR